MAKINRAYASRRPRHPPSGPTVISREIPKVSTRANSANDATDAVFAAAAAATPGRRAGSRKKAGGLPINTAEDSTSPRARAVRYRLPLGLEVQNGPFLRRVDVTKGNSARAPLT